MFAKGRRASEQRHFCLSLAHFLGLCQGVSGAGRWFVLEEVGWASRRLQGCPVTGCQAGKAPPLLGPFLPGRTSVAGMGCSLHSTFGGCPFPCPPPCDSGPEGRTPGCSLPAPPFREHLCKGKPPSHKALWIPEGSGRRSRVPQRKAGCSLLYHFTPMDSSAQSSNAQPSGPCSAGLNAERSSAGSTGRLVWTLQPQDVEPQSRTTAQYLGSRAHNFLSFSFPSKGGTKDPPQEPSLSMWGSEILGGFLPVPTKHIPCDLPAPS